jgi:hypothetical protein
MKERLIRIGNLYLKVYEVLNRFKEFNIEGRNEDEVQKAVDWLEEAYQADGRILEEFISLRDGLT